MSLTLAKTANEKLRISVRRCLCRSYASTRVSFPENQVKLTGNP